MNIEKQKEIENKYSIQLWRDRTMAMLFHDTGAMGVVMTIMESLSDLIANQNKGYSKGVQWLGLKQDMKVEFILEMYTVLIEHLLRASKYSEVLTYTTVLPAFNVITNKYIHDAQDSWKAAFDMIWVLNKTGIHNAEGHEVLMYQTGYTESGQGAMFFNKTQVLGVFKEFKTGLDTTVKSLPPMVCKPKRWRKNWEGAYLNHSAPLVKNKGSSNEAYGYEAAAEVANIIQNQEFSINTDLLEKYHLTEWLLTKLEYKDALKLDRRIGEMVELLEGETLHIVPFFDERGRVYYRGWETNFQSSHLNKAMWELNTPVNCGDIK